MSVMSCINQLTEAMRSTSGMRQHSKSKSDKNHNVSLDFQSNESEACHEMIRDFEKDGVSQVFMIDLVGKYLDDIVKKNDRCQV